jgi:hypothetical protein
MKKESECRRPSSVVRMRRLCGGNLLKMTFVQMASPPLAALKSQWLETM